MDKTSWTTVIYIRIEVSRRLTEIKLAENKLKYYAHVQELN